MNSITTTMDTQALPWQTRPLLSVIGRIAKGTLLLTTPEGYGFRFGDGSEPRADIQLTNWPALHRIFRGGDIGLAECDREGEIGSSDLTALLRLGIQNQAPFEQAIRGNRLLKIGPRFSCQQTADDNGFYWRHSAGKPIVFGKGCVSKIPM